MKLVLFIHDFFPEIGHARAMAETLKKFPDGMIQELHIICMTSAELDEIFPDKKYRVSIHCSPISKLKPFLLKAIFFHLWSFIYAKMKFSKDYKFISIGIASLKADVINVQFVHKQWAPIFFQLRKTGFVGTCYKKILFSYLNWIERRTFTRKGTRLVTLSQFIHDFCQKEYSLPKENVFMAYSGINLDQYYYEARDKSYYLSILKDVHPEILRVDLTRPIFLFVGAYERKGLPYALQALKKVHHPQIIVVGQADGVGDFEFPKGVDIISISHSKHLREIYSISDTFLFPTHYEPFGLVIFEAIMMGLCVFTTKRWVGASELLDGLEEVYLCQAPDEFEIGRTSILSPAKRVDLIRARKAALKEVTWDNVAKTFQKALEN